MKKPLLPPLIAALICQTAFAAEEPTAKLAEEIGTHVGFMHGWKLTPKLTLDYCIQAYPSNADTLRGEYAKWVSANKAQIILVDEYFANFIPFFARAMKADKKTAERWMNDMSIQNANDEILSQPKEKLATICQEYAMYVGMLSAQSVIDKLNATANRLDEIKRHLPEHWKKF